MCRKILEKGESDIAFLEKFYKNTSIAELKTLAEKPFVHISYTEAIKELEKSKEKFEFLVKWGLDLQSEHERYLTDKVFEGQVIVTGSPKEIKAFYMRLNSDETTVAAMDVLVPKIGEIMAEASKRGWKY